MDHFKDAWAIVQRDLLAWVALCLVFSIGVSVTGGLAIVLYPNLLRVIRRAIEEGAAPDIGKLIDVDDIGDDVVVMLLRMVADGIGSLACGVGALVTQVLFFWAPMIAVERRYAPMEAMKASLAHAKSNFVDVLLFLLGTAVLNIGGLLLCCVGLLVTVPMTFVATWLYWQANRDAVYAAADAEGVARKA